MTPPVIDSHLHVWDLERAGYPWLGPEHGPLYRSFLPGEAADELRAAGVRSAVLVQAEDSAEETRFLLSVAERFPFVAGVVGWVALDDPETASRQLQGYGRHPKFCGVRHLVHADPRKDFLELPPVRRSLTALAAHGLPFDVPDAWPHLEDVGVLADAIPALTVVVDHLGKPPRGTGEIDQWATTIAEVAEHPNTVAKISGLQMPGEPLSGKALAPVLDVALQAFGSRRLMYGGDWPMTLGDGGYRCQWEVVTSLLAVLSDDERDDILFGTANRVYSLGQ